MTIRAISFAGCYFSLQYGLQERHIHNFECVAKKFLKHIIADVTTIRFIYPTAKLCSQSSVLQNSLKVETTLSRQEKESLYEFLVVTLLKLAALRLLLRISNVKWMIKWTKWQNDAATNEAHLNSILTSRNFNKIIPTPTRYLQKLQVCIDFSIFLQDSCFNRNRSEAISFTFCLNRLTARLLASLMQKMRWTSSCLQSSIRYILSQVLTNIHV